MISGQLFQQAPVLPRSATQAIEITPTLLANDLQLQGSGSLGLSITVR